MKIVRLYGRVSIRVRIDALESELGIGGRIKIDPFDELQVMLTEPKSFAVRPVVWYKVGKSVPAAEMRRRSGQERYWRRMW